MILDGIRYRIFSTGCIVGIMGLFLAIVSVVHDKKYLAASLLSLAFSLIYVTSYLYVLMNPLIISFTGKFKESYRDSRIAPPLPDFIDGVQNTKKNKKGIQRRAPFKQMLLKY